MKILKLFPTLIMLSSSASYAAEPLFYVVRNGDTLSTIAQKQIGSPIFRQGDGSLFKLLKMNPTVQVADFIFPGQKLAIGSSNVHSLTALESSETSPARKVSPETQPPRQLASAENLVIQPPAVEAQKASALSLEKTGVVEPKQIEIPHYLFLSGSMGMTTLSSTEATSTTGATLYSAQDFGVQAGWQQNWTDLFSTKVAAQFRSVEFQPPTSSTKSISDSKKFTTGMGVSAESKLSSKLSLNYGVSYNQELFLRGLTSTSVVVDSVAVPKLSLGGVYQIYAIGKTSVGVNGSVDYLMGAATDGYTVNAGTAYQSGLFIKRDYGLDNSVEIELSYRDRSQNTSQVNVHEKTVFGTLIFSLPLFEEGGSK